MKMRQYRNEDYLRLAQFKLPDEQKRFTALPEEAMKECIADPNRYPIVIESNDDLVGFFVLHKGDEIRDFTLNDHGMLIRALSIHYPHQRKGIALKAMKGLPIYVTEKFPFINELVLAVNVKNEAAQTLYKKAGFIDKGFKREGRIGLQYMLHYDL